MSNEKCPRDDEVLQQGTFHDVPLLHCPTCDGVLVQQASLMTLLKEMAKELSQSISLDSEIEAVPDKGANVSCPSCHSLMDNYGYMGSSDVMIDCCGQCMKLWIDTGELAVMCIKNERSNQRLDEQRQASKDHMRQLDKYNIQEAMHGAYMRGFIMGSIIF